jgi:WD40 repeat protein
MFVITGKPGTGKSAIAHRLKNDAASEPWALVGGAVVATHFCQPTDDRTLEPVRFVENLARQLTSAAPAIGATLLAASNRQPIELHAAVSIQEAEPGSEVSALRIGELRIGGHSGRSAFDRVIRRPLEQAAPGSLPSAMVAVIDGLDHALEFPGETIVDVLAAALQEGEAPLPLRFVVTSRSSPDILELPGCVNVDLGGEDAQARHDVRLFADLRLSNLEDGPRTELARKIARAARGNFLYAHHVLNDMLAGDYSEEDLLAVRLSISLTEYYRDIHRRQIARAPAAWREQHRSLLGGIAVARGAGLSRANLIAVTQVPGSVVDDFVGLFGSYLVGERPLGPFRVHHESFREFLLGDKSHPVYPEEANAALVRHLMRSSHEWLQCEDDYALSELPHHMLQAVTLAAPESQEAARRELDALLGNLQFLEARAGRLGMDAVLTDIATIEATLPQSNPLNSSLHRALRRQAHHLLDWDRAAHPQALAQQLLIEARAAADTDLERAALARLTEHGRPAILPRWSTVRPPRAFAGRLGGRGSRVVGLAAVGDSVAVAVRAGGSADAWSLVSGHELRRFEHDDVAALVVSAASGRPMVALGYEDGTVSAWDLASEAEIFRDTSSGEPVTALAFADDSTSVFAATGDRGYIYQWNLPSGERAPSPSSEGSAVTSLVVVDQGNVRISSLSNGWVKVTDARTGRRTEHAPSGFHPTLLVATPDGRRLAGVSPDGKLATTRMTHHPLRWERVATREPVNTLVIAPGGNDFLVGLDDGTVELRVMRHPLRARLVTDQRSPFPALALTPDGRTVLSGAQDGTISMWDVTQAGKERPKPAVHPTPVDHLALSSTGRYLIRGSNDGELSGWSTSLGAQLWQEKTSMGELCALDIRPDGERVRCLHHGGRLEFRSIKTGDPMYVRQHHPQARLLDGRWLLKVQPGAPLELIDDLTDEIVARLVLDPLDRCGAVSIAQDGSVVVAVVGGGLMAWRLRGESRGDLFPTQHLPGVHAVDVALTGDGRRAVWSDYDGGVSVWTFEGSNTSALGRHPYTPVMVRRLAGDRMVSLSSNGILQVWSASDAEPAAIGFLDVSAPTALAACEEGLLAVGDEAGDLHTLRCAKVG